jgi:hypothetical protein
MSRTRGHNGSRHTYWKHHNSHSSNKLNKIDEHKRVRTEFRQKTCNGRIAELVLEGPEIAPRGTKIVTW